MWITKKQLRKENAQLVEKLNELNRMLEEQLIIKNEIVSYNDELADKVEDLLYKYPLDIGMTVYDVQLRNSKGRFTKTKPSLEHSMINEVVVDKKNYFNLVDRYHSSDVFLSEADAKRHLEVVCIE